MLMPSGAFLSTTDGSDYRSIVGALTVPHLDSLQLGVCGSAGVSLHACSV